MKRYLIVAAVVLSACRDVNPVFELPPLEVDSSQGIRLTYSLGSDRAPFWSHDGDTVYYSSAGVYPPLPVTKGVLVGVPQNGGRLSIMMPNYQLVSTPARFLGGGALSPDGSRIAYFELKEDRENDEDCKNFCSVRDTVDTQPSLLNGVLNVSNVDGSGLTGNVKIPFAGRYWDPTHQHFGLTGAWVFTAHPFQRMILRTGAQPFRASWSPDGKQVVYSDGLQLLIYDIVTKQARPIPSSYDGIYPAWSPKGDWIAYSRPLRSDSVIAECYCFNQRSGQIAREERRVIFNYPTLGSGALVLIKPDASQIRVLGPGDMPTWMPDGEGLVFRRGAQLWRSTINGTDAQAIPLTEDAEEPAVSPDGKRIAFVRTVFSRGFVDTVNPDIWVVPFRINK